MASSLLTNLVSYWKLDESSGNANDSVGSNTLTNNNSTPFVAGKINNGADLERGSSQYFEIADASQSGLDLSTNASFSCWINLESHPTNGQYYGIINKWKNAGQRAYELFYFQESGVAHIQFDSSSNGTANAGSIDYVVTLSTATWYHIVVTKAGTSGKMYVNGVQVATGTLASSLFNGTDAFSIGRLASSDFFDGIIDEVGVWSKELTAQEVTTLYNSGAGLSYPFTTTSIKTINGLAKASVKTFNGLAIASVKSINGLE